MPLPAAAAAAVRGRGLSSLLYHRPRHHGLTQMHLRMMTATTTTTITETPPSSPPPASSPSHNHSCDHQDDKVAGRVVDPERDRLHYMPEGMGHDPADQGKWLQPGEDGHDHGKETARMPIVEDKITGEKLRDTDVLIDRRSE